MATDRIRGYCPMGCGETLFADDGGHLICSWHECPDPLRLSSILEVNEPDHIVTFTDTGWTIRHPLSERYPASALEDCDLHRHCERLDGPPVKPGRYIAFLWANHWKFAEVRNIVESDREARS